MEAHAEQDITLVLMDKNVYDLSDGSGKCAAVVGMKDCLIEGGKIDNNGSVSSWKASQRYTWCNSEFINALPEIFGGCIKETTVGKSTLPLPKEINGSLEYYKIVSNRKKGGYGSNSEGYFLADGSGNSWNFVNTTGKVVGRASFPNTTRGITVHMAI